MAARELEILVFKDEGTSLGLALIMPASKSRVLVTGPMGLSQRSLTLDEEYQGEAERELPGFALTKGSDAALGRHQKRGALWVAAGSWRSPYCGDGGSPPRAGISHASHQELGARDQPNGSESANNLS